MLQKTDVLYVELMATSIMTETVYSVGSQHMLGPRGRVLMCLYSQRGQLSSKTVLKSCEERGDNWAATVKACLLHVHDLHAADAVYHQVCSVKFRTKKRIPGDHPTSLTTSKKIKLGQPQDKESRCLFRSCELP